MTDQVTHYDKNLEGAVLCGRQDYDHAHEDIRKVTCKDCLRINKKNKTRKYKFETIPCPMCVQGFNARNVKGLNKNCGFCRGTGVKRQKVGL
jgi:hypothetical protein